MYFANPCGTVATELMRAGTIGFIDTPLQGNKRPPGVTWCADNGCFNDEKFSEKRWYQWLQRNAHDTHNCIFATAPDVYGDAAATIERSKPWLPKIRALGYPAAFVAQDGQQNHPVPWDEFDVLFIGGKKTERIEDEWKFSSYAQALITEARRRGKHVHCGRINSYRRYRIAEAMGCHTCDGTFLVRAPQTNLPRMLRWLNDFNSNPALFRMFEETA